MFRLKKWLSFGLALLVQSSSGFSQTSRADIDARRDWLHLRSLLSLDELIQCRVHRLQGEDSGRISFQQEAPNCAFLYIKGTYMAQALDEARMFQPLPEAGFDEACYQGGWLTGYLTAYSSLAPGCETQLTTVARTSLDRRIKGCEALGEQIANDSTSWVNFFEQHVESPSRAEARHLLENMASLVQIGHSGAAWDLMIKSQQSELFGSLPCNAAIAMKLRQ